MLAGSPALLLISLLLPLAQRPAAAPFTLEDFSWDANRDAVQNTKGILAALKLSAGDQVADVGAGTGYHAMLLSKIVGPNGKVFAEDVDARYIVARIELFHLSNLISIQGSFNDPMLPKGALDAVLVVDTFHHFTDPAAMLKGILASLKPGGRLVIADYSILDHRRLTRPEQIKRLEIDPAVVRTEAENAGFEFVHADDPFFIWQTAQGNTRGIPTDLWLLTLKRPQ